MSFTTLIDSATLAAHLDDPDWAIVDCRFALDQPARGRQAYLQAHIPGAVYAHLDEDLSGPIVPGRTGRHPLPSVEDAARTFGRWGIDERTQVIAYDDAGGAFAARLWWLLRWLGHNAVAVLDGGWPRWLAEGRPARNGVEQRAPRRFVPRPRPELVVTAEEVLHRLHDAHVPIIDARAPERYRGEVEPIDPVAGHIPGARNAPYSANLAPDGRFLPPAQLAERWRAVLGTAPAEQAILYCGSGVTAAHNALALAHAGLGLPRLYAGSWSEWITDATRPIERGAPEEEEAA
ncbi:sulfurtransferase [Kallotenue papyrolyticum]|uniref:sulfurtransferase n=1 Tax=Kallotenue papyrolyticum TaxID=1325125 RepID=UPI00047859C0|nr:sulfurtransferase [Kallotenue papyrolyticum]